MMSAIGPKRTCRFALQMFAERHSLSFKAGAANCPRRNSGLFLLVLFTRKGESLNSRAMGKPGQRQRPSLHRVGFNERISPDDILARLMDKDQREAADNRTEAQRHLNDPPPGKVCLGSASLRQFNRKTVHAAGQCYGDASHRCNVVMIPSRIHFGPTGNEPRPQWRQAAWPQRSRRVCDAWQTPLSSSCRNRIDYAKAV
jgi:hypothetical protein